ncbi:hypothetical protein BH11PLA2_BH11PLA2_34700 [soil metagenome]
MSRRKVKAGITSVTVPIFVQDATSPTLGGLGALAFNTSGLTGKFRRQGSNTWTAITLVTATLGTYTDSGFIIDSGAITGMCEVGIPDAALAAGARWAQVLYWGAANMVPVLLEFELDTIDYQVANGKLPVTLAGADVSGTLPDAAGTTTLLARIPGTVQPQTGDAYARIGAAGAGLTSIGDTRMANLDAAVSSRSTYAGTDTAGTTTLLTRIPGTVQPQTGDAYARLGAPTGASIAADVATRMATFIYTAPDNTNIAAAAAAAAALQTTIGVAGAGLTNLGDARLAHLNADITSRMATFSYTAPDNTSIAAAAAAAAALQTTVGVAGAGLTNLGDARLAHLNADITSRMATFSYVAAPTVAAIRTGIWQDMIASSDFTTAGSVGALLVAGSAGATPAQVATAVWTGLLSDSNFLVVDSVGFKFAALVAGGVAIEFVSPVLLSGQVEIVAGDDYLTADARALEWTSGGAWPDLTAATIELDVHPLAVGSPVITQAGSVVVPSGVSQKIRVELASTETAVEPGAYSYQVRATLADGSQVTLVRGDRRFIVRPDYSA